MTTEITIFQGNANVYLQGKNALEVVQKEPDHFLYNIGSVLSGISIRDFRVNAYIAAQKAICGDTESNFEQSFSQPALTTITVLDDKVNIEMHESSEENCVPTIWMGVAEDGEELPLTYIDWEAFRFAGTSKTGFAALIPSENL